MPAFDYWDIDDILSEQLEVTVRANTDIKGGGLLLGADAGGLKQDLRAAQKVQVPFWLAQALVRRNTAELEIPPMFGVTAREDLLRESTVCRVGDWSQYYFEVGMRIASLQEDNQSQSLVQDLLKATKERWDQMVVMLREMGVPRLHHSGLNPGLSIFPQTFTAHEHDMYSGIKEAESQFKRWEERFAVYQMRASQIAEAPAKKPRLSA
eukprot:TRINITY_DN3959_c0_g1_i1.p1 TRINITY_DN3959_c0_g1~~TRINITY_DN3959_c0_g1_i1.p1  ORF type:complete len:209 (-),score=44.64 TRINITY_DN3959_c0_g1_i1:154-780(-)